MKLYIVVKVWRGIPESVEAYRTRKDAEIRESFIRQEIDLQYDETDVFEIDVHTKDEITAMLASTE